MTANYASETTNWPTRGLWAAYFYRGYRAASTESLTAFELAGFNEIEKNNRESCEFYTITKFGQMENRLLRERQEELFRKMKEKEKKINMGLFRREKGISMTIENAAQR